MVYVLFFFFNDTATTEIYTLSLHDALPIYTYSPMLHSVSVIAPVPAVVILDGQGVHRAWDSVSLYVFTGHGWQTSITSCFPAGHETVGNTLNIEKDVRLDYTGYIDSSH